MYSCLASFYASFLCCGFFEEAVVWDDDKSHFSGATASLCLLNNYVRLLWDSGLKAHPPTFLFIYL